LAAGSGRRVERVPGAEGASHERANRDGPRPSALYAKRKRVVPRAECRRLRAECCHRASSANARAPNTGRVWRPTGSRDCRVQCWSARDYALGLASPSGGAAGGGTAGGVAGAVLSAFRRDLGAPLAADALPAMAALRRVFRRSWRRCRRRRISFSFSRTEGLLVGQFCSSWESVIGNNSPER
jgi:hypothetical protein